jgi:thiamine biosynthesis lipoprotein
VLVHVEQVMGTVVSFHVATGAADPGAGGTGAADPGAADPGAADPGAADPGALSAPIAAACAELHQADEMFSTWRADSPMSRVRQGALSVRDAPAVVAEVLALCEQVRDATGGWFDPWSMPGGVDPTGLVKGWAAERALAVLLRAGVHGALVNAGGDLCAAGRPSGGERWRVGVRHPWRPDALACIVHLDAAMATSATYERGPHLVDPRTGRPGARAASGTVLGPDLAVADALATALAVGGDEVYEMVADLDGYDAYLVRRDGTEAWTEGVVFAD